MGLVLVAGALPTLLSACGGDDDPVAGPGNGEGGTSTSVEDAKEQARAVVGDVVDFSLTPDGWDGAFGFVTMKLHKGAFDGQDCGPPGVAPVLGPLRVVYLDAGTGDTVSRRAVGDVPCLRSCRPRGTRVTGVIDI